MSTFYETTQNTKTQGPVGTGFFSYLLYTDGGKRTYVGATNDPDRRLRQHNGEISGGAYATKGRKWTRALYVGGFPDWQTTLQFEWAWKHYSRKQKTHGLRGKLDGLLHVLQLDKPTSKAVPYVMWPHKLFIHSEPSAKADLEKIDTYCCVIECVAPHSKLNTSIPSNLFLPTMSSSSDIASLAIQVDLLSTEVKSLSERLAAALAKIDAPVADAPVKRTKATDETKAKKTKAPKEKPTCPAAEDGVIRFYSSAGDSPYKSFSNLAKAEFTINDKSYFSVENYFQSEKFSTTDPEYAEKIRAQKNPALVKGMGKSKAHPVPEDWDSKRLDVMRKGLHAKFAAHADLKDKLLATGDAKIEEESPSDSFWGIGADGQGMNWSGKLLMELREALRA